MAEIVCCYCGACATFVDFEKYIDEETVYDKGCGGKSGFCFSFCPHSFPVCGLCEEECPRKDERVCDFSPSPSRPEQVLGHYKKVICARAKDARAKDTRAEDVRAKNVRAKDVRTQDGGAVTAILCEALRSGFIDAAVVAGRREDWKAEPIVATTPEEVKRCAGSKYTACPSVLGVFEAIKKGYEKIAMVGTGCAVEAVRRLQAMHFPELNRVKLLIGLFCTEALWHRDLVSFLAERGIDIREVERFYVAKGKFIAVVRGEEFGFPTSELEDCVRDTCRLCSDFTAQLADISAGSVGSPKGFTTLIIRTDTGEEVLKIADNVLETKEVDSKGIEKIKKRALIKKMKNFGRIRDQMEMCKACLTNPLDYTLQFRCD